MLYTLRHKASDNNLLLNVMILQAESGKTMSAKSSKDATQDVIDILWLSLHFSAQAKFQQTHLPVHN